MSDDFRTQQDAAAFWRKVDQKIVSAVKTAMNEESGIVPGVEYGSAIYNAAGRAVWGGAGAGALAIGVWAYTEGPLSAPELETPIDLLVDSAEQTGVYDTSTFWASGNPTRITFPVDGVYTVSYSLEFEDATVNAGVDGTFREAYLLLHYGAETAQVGHQSVVPITADSTVVSSAGLVNVEANDYMELWLSQDTTVDLDVYRIQVKAQYLGPRITPLP